MLAVAPLVGAWIEIKNGQSRNMLNHVAPLVGAWIEIAKLFADKIKKGSLPSWERGLKLPVLQFDYGHSGRSPRGSVD